MLRYRPFASSGAPRRVRCWLFSALVVSGLPAAEGQVQENDFKDELPRIAAVEPQKALKTFKIHEDFEIELVASEPQIADPVAMAFDENGRLFVAQMRGYSEWRDDRRGQVSMLEDVDGDGRYETSHLYVDGLSWPTAVICYSGGVYVAATPDILYCKDTDGDGHADIRQVVYRGFGHENVQGILNSFRWHLDNRIHAAASRNRASIRTGDDPDAPAINLTGRIFAIDPRTHRIEVVGGCAQHGMSFDDWGRVYLSANSNHLQMLMFEDRYLARNPDLAAPGGVIDIAADGGQAEVYRISPVEPWRVVRTRLRVAGNVGGVIEGGGRAAGYFTGSTGATVYRGDAWPDQYRGNVFIGDVGSNIVHRKVLEEDGVAMIGRRADPHREFLASTDIWFRPAQFANGPDGNLYVIDVYREVIEHPASLQPTIKKHLDLKSGDDRGRIYRIVPKGFEHRKGPRLSQANMAQLVATLEHPNGWHRDTAARLLYQRQDHTVLEALRRLAMTSKRPLGRIHALYALEGLGALTEKVILWATEDVHPRVREHAIRLAEPHLGESAAIRQRLALLVEDEDMRVRYQLAFTLGQMDISESDDQKIEPLVTLMKRDGEDRWIRLAVFSSVRGLTGRLFSLLMQDQTFNRSPYGQGVLEAVAVQIGRQNAPKAIAIVLQNIAALPVSQQDLAGSLVLGLGRGLNRSGKRLDQAVAGLEGANHATRLLGEILRDSSITAVDHGSALEKRLGGVRALELGTFAEVGHTLAVLIDPREPFEIQQAAVEVLWKFNDPAVGAMLLEVWGQSSPRLRRLLGEALLGRSDRVAVLLDAIEAGRFVAADLELARIRQLREHRDPSLRKRAVGLLGQIGTARRDQVVQDYRQVLEMDGDAVRGKELFKNICAACHKSEGVGHEIGPNLAAMSSRGPEAILLNVLDPSREMNPQYIDYVVATRSGDLLTGMIKTETTTSIMLMRGEQAGDIILRSDIEEMRSTGLSIMPEGLEQQIDHQGMADLIAYLMLVK